MDDDNEETGMCSRPDERGCCFSCCCLCCSIVGILGCCGSMSRTLRMKLLFVYLHLTGLVLGIVFGVVYLAPMENYLAPTDMKYVSGHLSPIFCEATSLRSMQGNENSNEKFDAFLMDTPPLIDSIRREMYNESLSKFVTAQNPIHQKFYLLEGSVVRIKPNVQMLTSFYIVKGLKNFELLSENNYFCDDCYIKAYTFYTSWHVAVSLDILDTDDYYFVTKTLEDDGWINLNYNINRSIFYTENHIDSCLNTDQCHFKMTYITNDQVGIIVHRQNSDNYENVNIELICNIRTWMFMILFFIIPLILSLFGSCLIFTICPDSNTASHPPSYGDLFSRRSINFSDHSRDPLLPRYHENYNRNYSSTWTLPPNYDHIVKTNKLPTYEEATTSNINNTN